MEQTQRRNTQGTGSRRAVRLSRLASLARASWRRLILAVALLTLVLWALAPAVRAYTLVSSHVGRPAPDALHAGIPVESVRFPAADGALISGWFALASPSAPTVILVHGFKGSRVDMLPWARFLYAAGYNALLFDDRGCGQSEGSVITLGAHEPDDVIGAVRYLNQRTDLQVKRYGALGVSLGAGIVLMAAAREPAITAVIADSAWTDEQPQLQRMRAIPIGRIAVPTLPYEQALVDRLINANLEQVRPIAVIGEIAPRAVLLIHSADDANSTTPLSGERQLYAAAGAPKAQWIAPSGGHAGALAAHPADYQAHTLAFLAAYLGAPTQQG